MKRMRAILLLPMACIAGCNCEGDRVCTLLTSSTNTSSSASAAGIWSGTDSASGLGLTGFIDADGQADFYRSDGVQYVGTTQVSGTTLDIALDGYTQYGYQFSDGSTFGTGTLSGTHALASGSTIQRKPAIYDRRQYEHQQHLVSDVQFSLQHCFITWHDQRDLH